MNGLNRRKLFVKVPLSVCLTRFAYLVRYCLVVGSIPAVAELKNANAQDIRFVEIPAGSFTMGCSEPVAIAPNDPDAAKHGDWDERPTRRVTISKPFYMSVREITVGQYRAFRPEFDRGRADDEPVSASWDEAVAYCEWISSKEGRFYRLPTEAEWEYACRAGTTGAFWSGDAPPSEDKNPWGLVNMHLGLPEWCLDWHGMYPDLDETDPVGPQTGWARIVRGGPVFREDPSRAVFPEAYFRRSSNRAGLAPGYPLPSGWQRDAGVRIGFRIAQAAPPAEPRPANMPFFQACVKPARRDLLMKGPLARPHFRKRAILPIPPDNATPAEIEALAMHPGLLGHFHSPAVAVCPNGDVVVSYFCSTRSDTEYWPNVAFAAMRLRYGADEWDIPSVFFDFPDVPEETPLFWQDGFTLWFVTGGVGLPGVPFKWTRSEDNGASWDVVHYPRFNEPIGPHTAQPINSMFRGPGDTLYLATDGEGGSSLLWASRDNGRAWFDTDGRTGGRHTTFVVLNDGRILGMGGKNTDIDGFMPKSISSDGGRSWIVSKTPFPALASNQRPIVLRLRSARLFFAGDFQANWTGRKPRGVTESGAYVALSEDEGETWIVKRLDAAEPHEKLSFPGRASWVGPEHREDTLGYAVAAQGADGVIHLITSMNHPNLHFEMNEAWILDIDNQNETQSEMTQGVESSAISYPDGSPRARWNTRETADGQFVLHGTETWYYRNGRKEWEATYDNGRKTGTESYWRPDGELDWTWEYRPDGTRVWTQWWGHGRKKAESHWRGRIAHGRARRWSRDGMLESDVLFRDGTVDAGGKFTGP